MNWAPTVAMALVGALVLGTLARRLGQSPLLGYLLAGILIGPYTPGFIGDAELARQLADVGVVLLMFGVGLGFSFQDLLAVRRLAVPGALLASGAVVVFGTLLGMALGWPLGGGAVLGMCLATASTVLIVRGMTELGLLAASPGRIAVGWSLVEDLITVVLLVVLPALAPSADPAAAGPLWQAVLLSLGKVAVLAAVVMWGGGKVVPYLLALVARAQSRELFTLAVLTVALGVAFLAAEGFDVSIALGAFLGGMVVGRSDLAHQAAADALPMRDAFAVLFFVSAGMLFDPAAVLAQPLAVVTALALVLVVKPAVAVVFLLWRRQASRTAFSVSAGIAQVSEFSFVLAASATALGILPPGGRDLVLATALCSIAASPILFRGVPFLDRWISQRPGYAERQARRSAELAELRPAVAGGLQDHVVLVGYGRVGSVLGGFLQARGVPFVVVDSDRALVERLRAGAVPALFGDACSPVLLDRAEVQRAKVLVLTAPDPVSQRLAIAHARSVQPGIQTLVRVHTSSQFDELSAQPGARPVHAERELGLAMARQLLEALGATPIEAEATVLSTARGAGGRDRPPRLFEIQVPDGGAVVGRKLAELRLPAAALVVAVVRNGSHLVARGPTMLEPADILLVFATGEDAQAVEQLVRQTAEAAAGDAPQRA